jgi:hypothetical protein
MSSKGLSLQMRYEWKGKGKRVPVHLELVDRSKYTGERLRAIRAEPQNYFGEVRR